jgi:hypothetical protein
MKFSPYQKCSYPQPGTYVTDVCSENVTHWMDNEKTLKPTSEFNLGMFFDGDGPGVCIDSNGQFEDYNQRLNFLCQKQCRLKGKSIFSFFLIVFLLFY